MDRTTTPPFWKQVMILTAQGLRVDWSNKERLLSPLLFALTVLILFSFALGDIDQIVIQRIFVAQNFLTIFFSLQLLNARCFEPESADGVLPLLKTYPIDASAFFCAKYLVTSLGGLLLVLPTAVISGIFYERAGQSLLTAPVIGVTVIATLGLSALGILVSAIVASSSARQMVYPILYFPLCAPVLIAAVEATEKILGENASLESLLDSWLGLLLVFLGLFLTIGIAMFGELIHQE